MVFFVVQGAVPNPTREVLFIGSAAHFGGQPATWEFLYPDLSNVAGFNTSWAPSAGQPVAFYGEAFAAREELLFGATPNVGETLRLAYRITQTSTLLRANEPALRRTRPPRMPRQYFRR